MEIKKVKGVGDGQQTKTINQLIERSSKNYYSGWKFISDSSYEIHDDDHKKILVFDHAAPTITANANAKLPVECLVIYDGSGTLTFSGITRAVNTTITQQYGAATVLKDSNGNWRILGGS